MAELVERFCELLVRLPTISMKDAREVLSKQVQGLLSSTPGEKPESFSVRCRANPKPHAGITATAKPGFKAFTDFACFTSAWIASVVLAVALLTASQQDCTEPNEIRTPNMLFAMARVSLRVSRKRPPSKAMRA